MFSVTIWRCPLMAAERRTSNMSMSNYENNGKLISREVLVNFVAQYAFAYIGHDGEKQTTLSDEMSCDRQNGEPR